MALSEEQLRLRDGKITASFLPALMAGDETRIVSEWKRLVGDPSYVADNLDDIWAVQLGSWIEPFALDWHQKKTGRALTRRGEVVTHPNWPHVSCTLDAYRADDAFVLDVKAIGAYRKLDEVCAYYAPQIVIQKACLQAKGGALLIVHGGAEPVEHPIEVTPEYDAQVWERVDWFWACVETLTPPIEAQPITAPVLAVKEYDMRESNMWAEDAALWLENHPAAKRFASAEKELKAAVPADAARCFGHGVIVKRDRAGRLSISAMK